MGELNFLIEVVKASAPSGVLVVVIWRLLQNHEKQIAELTKSQKELIEVITENINHNSYILSRIEKVMERCSVHQK